MEYQLVIQFRGDSLADLDAAAELENEIVEALDDKGDVDGHDIGSGETNIFILTSDPARTFALIKPILKKAGRLKSVITAYRDVDKNDYTIIWPLDSKRKFELA